jgi:hypothetical protein
MSEQTRKLNQIESCKQLEAYADSEVYNILHNNFIAQVAFEVIAAIIQLAAC